MTYTNFPFGITSFGIPVIPTGISFSATSKSFFVDATNGGDGNAGTSVTKPLATIQKAIDLCRSGTGDTIFVAPGTYDENLTITSKDYITIVGCVVPGYARPDVAPSTGIALNCVTSQGLVLKHMRFVSEDADSVVNQGNGFLFDDCVFDGGSGQAATECNLRLVGNADDDSYTASEGTITNCLFRDCTGTAGALIFQHAAAPSGVGVTDTVVAGCRFYGNAGPDIYNAANTSGGGAGINLRLTLTGNQFADVDKAVYLDMDQASFAGGDGALNTGIMSQNWFADDAALDATKIDISGTSYRFVGNFNAIGVVDGSTFDN